METAEVVDRESLEAYLNGLSPKLRRAVSVELSFEAALMAAPASLEYFSKNRPKAENGSTILIPLAGLIVTAVAKIQPQPNINSNAVYWASLATDRYEEIDLPYIAKAATASIANACSAAHDALAASGSDADEEPSQSDEHYDYVEYALISVVEASIVADVWRVVRAVLEGAYRGKHETRLSNTMVHDSNFVQRWGQTLKNLETDKSGTDWTFWSTWYNRLSTGKSIREDLLVPILNDIPERDWQGDPDRLNARFTDVLAAYLAEDAKELAEKTPYGELVSYEAKAHNYVLTRDDQITDNFLNEVLDQIAAAIRLFGDASGLSNQYSALGEVIARLEDVIENDATKPVQIFKNVLRVQTRIARLIDKKECPSAAEDDNIDELQSILAEVSLDLQRLSDKVQAYNDATGRRLAVENHQVLADGIGAVLVAVDPEFREALEKDRAILLDPDASEEDKADAAYATGSRFSRGYRAARKALKEGAEVFDDVGKVAKGVAWTAGTATAVYAFLGPQVILVIQTLLRAFAGVPF